MGRYPFVEAKTDPALHQEIVTVLYAKTYYNAKKPAISIRETKKSWEIGIDKNHAVNHENRSYSGSSLEFLRDKFLKLIMLFT